MKCEACEDTGEVTCGRYDSRSGDYEGYAGIRTERCERCGGRESTDDDTEDE